MRHSIYFILITALLLASTHIFGQEKFDGEYRLYTKFRGEKECLEGNQASSKVKSGAAFMDKKQNVSGQIWKIVPVKDGYYRLKTKFRGKDECLECNEAGSKVHNGAAFMDKCQNVSGQLWKIIPAGNGYYKLKTMFRGEEEALEGNEAGSTVHGGAAFMDKDKNVSGQLWKIEKLNKDFVPRVDKGSSSTWSFGYGKIGGDFKAMSKNGEKNNITSIYASDTWHGVHRNNGDSDVPMSAGLVFKPKKTVMHPGNGAEHLTKIRFTAPEDGQYAVSVEWKAIDEQAQNIGTAVYTNAKGVEGKTDSSIQSGYKVIHKKLVSKVNSTSTYKASLKLKKGEIIQFEVGNAGDAYFDDALETKIRLVKL